MTDRPRPNSKWPDLHLPEELQTPKRWATLLAQVAAGWSRVVVIGDTDTGKSTLCNWLATKLSKQGLVAVVDADVGQSRIGPPATVGSRFVGQPEGEFYFVGDVTPAPRVADCLAGTARLVQRAQQAGADYVIVDTSGFVDGPYALSLKKAKIELLAPALVIPVAHKGRLQHLIEPFAADRDVEIFELEPLDCCSKKSRTQRTEWRQKLFAEWLAGSQNYQISWQDRSIIGLPNRDEVQASGPEEIRGLLIGLLDPDRIGRALGLLRTIDYHNRKLTILAPPDALSAPVLQFGRLRLEPDGTALPGRPDFV